MKGKTYTIGFYVSDCLQDTVITYAMTLTQAIIDCAGKTKCDYYNQVLVLRVQ